VLGDLGGIDVQCLDVGVDEDRDGVGLEHARRRGQEGVGRHEHLVSGLDAGGRDRHVERGRAGVGCKDVRHVRVVRPPLLQRLHRAYRPVPGNGVVDCFEHRRAVLVGDMWPWGHRSFGHDRRAPADG
jgi:hypothetical protein